MIWVPLDYKNYLFQFLFLLKNFYLFISFFQKISTCSTLCLNKPYHPSAEMKDCRKSIHNSAQKATIKSVYLIYMNIVSGIGIFKKN